MRVPNLTDAQLLTLLDLVTEHRDAVERGDVVGYGQALIDELADLAELRDALLRAPRRTRSGPGGDR